MANKISRSVSEAADAAGRRAALTDDSPEFQSAGSENHHLVIGPGEPAASEYVAAGLALPDLDAMRSYRLERIREQLRERALGGILVMDPMNIRYATDTTNMQIWVMHNAARYAWVSTDGPVILWDFFECDFLSHHNKLVDEVRPAIGSTFFLAGTRHEEQAQRFASEILDVIRTHAGERQRIAIDQCHHVGYKAFEAAGHEIVSGQEVMEMARSIKGPDEILAMRCAVNSCETTMAEMRSALRPGMTERELWSMLHAGNILRGGEWIETQIIASGPRTNPWMQEASGRVMEEGELVAYDTDLVGAFGMMVDISRTWLVGGGEPTPAQQHVHALARETLDRNMELLTVGRTFGDVTHQAWSPPVEDYRHYCIQYHGVGQCDEYPEIQFPEAWNEWGYEGVLEPNMVLTVESYVGPRSGGEGCKLEIQVLVTPDGPERLDYSSLELVD